MSNMNQSTPQPFNGSQLGQTLKQKASETGAKASQKLSETTQHLSDTARDFGEKQKAMGADQMQGIAGAVHNAARELHENMPAAAALVDSTANQLESAASALRDRTLSQLLQDVGDFARREPTLFFGGAVIAGCALSHFLKSSQAGTNGTSADLDNYNGSGSQH